MFPARTVLTDVDHDLCNILIIYESVVAIYKYLRLAYYKLWLSLWEWQYIIVSSSKCSKNNLMAGSFQVTYFQVMLYLFHATVFFQGDLWFNWRTCCKDQLSEAPFYNRQLIRTSPSPLRPIRTIRYSDSSLRRGDSEAQVGAWMVAAYLSHGYMDGFYSKVWENQG